MLKIKPMLLELEAILLPAKYSSTFIEKVCRNIR